MLVLGCIHTATQYIGRVPDLLLKSDVGSVYLCHKYVVVGLYPSNIAIIYE